MREEGARKGPERRERRRSRGWGCGRVREDAAKGADGGGRRRGEAAEGASGGEHGSLAGGRDELRRGVGCEGLRAESFRLVGFRLVYVCEIS